MVGGFEYAGCLWVGCLLAVLSTSAAVAEDALPPTRVATLEAIERDLRAYLTENPKDATAYFELGRAYLFAYANDRTYFVLDLVEGADVPWRLREKPLVPVYREPIPVPLPKHRLDRLVNAIAVLREGVEADPGSGECRVALAFAYAELGELWELEAGVRDAFPPGEGTAVEDGRRCWRDNALELCKPVLARGHTGGEDDFAEPVSYAAPITAHILFQRGELSDEKMYEINRTGGLALDLMRKDYWERTFERPEPLPDDALAALDAMYPPVPEERNGARFMLDAADAHVDYPWYEDGVTDHRGKFVLPKRVPVNQESLRRIDAYLEANGTCFDLIAKGIVHTEFRYPVDFRYREGVSIAHTYALRTISGYLRIRAVHAVLTGSAQEVVDSVLLSLTVAESVAKEPITISQLLRGAYLAMAAETVAWVLNHGGLNGQQLLQVQDSFRDLDSMGMIHSAIQGTVWELELPKDFTEEARDHLGLSGGRVKPEDLPPGLLEKQIQTWTEGRRDRLEAWRANETRAERGLVPLVSKALEDEASDDSDRALPASTILNLANRIARIRLIQIALALERFRGESRQLPAELSALVPAYIDSEALVDPFGGEQLQWQLGEDRYTLYSVAYPSLNERAKREDESAPSAISFTRMF